MTECIVVDFLTYLRDHALLFVVEYDDLDTNIELSGYILLV